MIGSKSILVALISAGLGAATLQVVRAANSAAPGLNTAAAVNTAQKMDDDSYPHMRKALRDLHSAKDSWKDAEPRFKGHRDKAIDHVDAAIKECEDALAAG